MRILGFDVGTKRIGVAISDETETIATGIKYIENDANVLTEVEKFIKEFSPHIIVVGNPINMDGTINANNKFIVEFLEQLKKIFDEKKIVLWDERLSTVQAEKILIKGEVRRKDRKKILDKISAAIVLQSYLDYLKLKNKNGK